LRRALDPFEHRFGRILSLSVRPVNKQNPRTCTAHLEYEDHSVHAAVINRFNNQELNGNWLRFARDREDKPARQNVRAYLIEKETELSQSLGAQLRQVSERHLTQKAELEGRIQQLENRVRVLEGEADELDEAHARDEANHRAATRTKNTIIDTLRRQVTDLNDRVGPLSARTLEAEHNNALLSRRITALRADPAAADEATPAALHAGLNQLALDRRALDIERAAFERQQQPVAPVIVAPPRSIMDRWGCPICYTPFSDSGPSSMRIYRCAHVLCTDCHTRVQFQSSDCPLCRQRTRNQEIITPITSFVQEE
jgi:hypothetical protein